MFLNNTVLFEEGSRSGGAHTKIARIYIAGESKKRIGQRVKDLA